MSNYIAKHTMQQKMPSTKVESTYKNNNKISNTYLQALHKNVRYKFVFKEKGSCYNYAFFAKDYAFCEPISFL